MLLGEYEHTIDDKNRLTLPAKFRRAFADGVVLSRGLDGCLYAYPRDRWERDVESRLAALDPLSREARQMRRHFFAGATLDGLDKQGRVTIPPVLLKHANLDRDAVVAGMHDHLEIWDHAAWQAQLADLEGRAEDVAEGLAAHSR